MATTIAYPEDETFVAEGQITTWGSSGGGPSFVPTFTTITVGDQPITIRSADSCRTCATCKAERRLDADRYSRGSFVLVTQIHGHYMVRTK